MVKACMDQYLLPSFYWNLVLQGERRNGATQQDGHRRPQPQLFAEASLQIAQILDRLSAERYYST